MVGIPIRGVNTPMRPPYDQAGGQRAGLDCETDPCGAQHKLPRRQSRTIEKTPRDVKQCAENAARGNRRTTGIEDAKKSVVLRERNPVMPDSEMFRCDTNEILVVQCGV